MSRFFRGLDDVFHAGSVQGDGLGEDQGFAAESHQGGDGDDAGRGGEGLLGFGVKPTLLLRLGLQYRSKGKGAPDPMPDLPLSLRIIRARGIRSVWGEAAKGGG